MKVTMITTINHNVGDDFVREGIKYLLRKHYGRISFDYIHKHAPITTRFGFESIRSGILSKIIDPLIPLSLTNDRILTADLIVQSGAPVFWCHNIGGNHCCENEWFAPLIKRRFSVQKERKFINIAAGSCQRYHSDGSEFLLCNKDIKYIKDLMAHTTVITVRDNLSKQILNSLGFDAPVIPCASIFAIDGFNIRPETGEFVAVNYMLGGGHYEFGQQIDLNKWRHTFHSFYHSIKNEERVVFVCHNKTEISLAKEIDKKATIFYSLNPIDYIKFYAKAKYGIMNRVHGAFVLASLGRPSLVIGNDSRAKMAHQIGLKSIFVNDASFEYLREQHTDLKNSARHYPESFMEIKKMALAMYMSALAGLK